MLVEALHQVAPGSKRLATPDGAIVARVKRREHAPAIIAGAGALHIVRTIAMLNEGLDRNAYALAEIRKARARLDEAEENLLRERSTVEDKLRRVLAVAAKFLRDLQGAKQ